MLHRIVKSHFKYLLEGKVMSKLSKIFLCYLLLCPICFVAVSTGFADELGGELKLQKKKEPTLEETLSWVNKTVKESHKDYVAQNWAFSSTCNKFDIEFKYDGCEINVTKTANGSSYETQRANLANAINVKLIKNKDDSNKNAADFTQLIVYTDKLSSGKECGMMTGNTYIGVGEYRRHVCEATSIYDCNSKSSKNITLDISDDKIDRVQKAVEHAVKICRKNVKAESNEPF